MTDKRLPDFSEVEVQQSHRPVRLQREATETIDLGGLFTRDIASSGSFDIRGGIWASTFGKLLQSLPVPAFLVDEHLEIMVANQACARISPEYEGIEGHPFVTLFPNASDTIKAIELLKEVFQSRKPKSMQGLLRIGKTKIWARLTFRSIRIIDVRSVLVLVEDLTNERKLLLLSRKYQEELELRVRERTAELRESNIKLQNEMIERRRAEDLVIQTERLRAVGEMSAGVAHNIKNLIQMLFGLTHAALNQLESGNAAGARRELENIQQSLQHGAETVRRLQDFSNMGADGSPERGTVFDLSALARQAVEFTKPFWETYPQSKGLHVHLRMSAPEGCFTKGNQGQIFEVLVNLIKNATEALTQGGEITLTTSIHAGNAELQVRDTGTGIRKEDINRLFTPFFTTKQGLGTGLGLATSRTIIDNHGGTISVQSTFGQGTTFTVRLPLAQVPEEPAHASVPESAHRRLTIMAVDDMESTLMMLKYGLEAYQHTVLTASSGDEALRLFRSNRIDLVLCDLAMPGINGWEVGRTIKCLCSDMHAVKPHFILLTAWGHQSFQESQLVESGVDAVLEKPIDIGQLIETIDNLELPG